MPRLLTLMEGTIVINRPTCWKTERQKVRQGGKTGQTFGITKT